MRAVGVGDQRQLSLRSPIIQARREGGESEEEGAVVWQPELGRAGLVVLPVFGGGGGGGSLRGEARERGGVPGVTSLLWKAWPLGETIGLAVSLWSKRPTRLLLAFSWKTKEEGEG